MMARLRDSQYKPFEKPQIYKAPKVKKSGLPIKHKKKGILEQNHLHTNGLTDKTGWPAYIDQP